MSNNTKRYGRLAAQRSRGGKRSYVTELENTQILIAWSFGDLSEGQAAKAIGCDRVTVRQMRIDAVQSGVDLVPEVPHSSFSRTAGKP